MLSIKSYISQAPLPDNSDALIAMLASQSRSESPTSGGSGLYCPGCTNPGGGISGGLLGGSGSRIPDLGDRLSIDSRKYELRYDVGTAASMDWALLNVYGPMLVRRRPQTCTGSGVFRDCNYVNLGTLPEMIGRPFEKYSRGTYRVAFQYYPYLLDEFRDIETSPKFERSFRY